MTNLIADTRLDTPTPQTVTGYVLGTIRREILTGRYSLGSKLDQQTLALELGVSIVPVRESLRQLQAEGLVKIYPHRGAFVTEVSHEELQEIYLVRITLEPLATRHAMPNFTPAILGRLEELLTAMQRSIAEQDLDTLLALNRTFHFTIYETCQRPLLVQIISMLWDRSTLYRRLATYSPKRAIDSHAEHEEIYAACKAGDVERAVDLIRHDLETTVEEFTGRIQRKPGNVSG